MSGPLIEARGITRVIDGKPPTTLVADIDFAMTPGEFVAITGPSGSGKSSLLYLLGLLDTPTKGEVLVNGVATCGLNEEARASMRLSPQVSGMRGLISATTQRACCKAANM